MLTLIDVAENPDQLSFEVTAPIRFTLRPLTHADERGLVSFFETLSNGSKRFFSLSEDLAWEARSRCDSIAQYDKLRLVVDVSGRLVGIVEFSLDLVSDDIERYSKNGINLVRENTIRFGPCVTDQYQGAGLSRTLMPLVEEVSKRFGRNRLILWGGVDLENKRAIGFYKSVGFTQMGLFENEVGRKCLDMYRDI